MTESRRFAAIFDVDKTLHDSDEFIKAAFEFALKTHGHDVPSREFIGIHMGKTLTEMYRIFAPTGDNEELKITHQLYQREHPELLKPFPDTLTTLTTLKIARIKIAAVTSRTKDSALDNLKLTEVFYYMDNIVTKNDVTEPKPSPEGIEKTLIHFDVKPENAWMTGDSPEDIEAGRAAGVYTIGFANEKPSEELLDSKPDAIVKSLSEIIPILSLRIPSLVE